MNALKEALNQAGIAIADADLQNYLTTLGLSEADLNGKLIPEIVADLAKTHGGKGGAIAKPIETANKPATTRKGRRKAQAPIENIATPMQQGQNEFQGNALQKAAIAHESMIQGVEDAAHESSVQGAERIVTALSNMSANSLLMANEALNEATAQGAFDPKLFRNIGASLFNGVSVTG